MATYTRPDAYVEDATRTSPSITPVSQSLQNLYGLMKRGPLRTPVAIRANEFPAKFDSVFGGLLDGEPAYYNLRGFFKNGGQLAQVSRMAHFATISDNTSFAGAVASADLMGVGSATRATRTGTVVSATPFPLATGDAIAINMNGGATGTTTFTALPAVKTGAAGAFSDPVPALTSTTYRVNGGALKTVDISSIDLAAATVEEYAATLNQYMEDVHVTVSGGQLRVTTDRDGSGASFQIVTPTVAWLTQTGLTATTHAGSGNVANSDAVTFAEFSSLVETAVNAAGDDIDVTQNATGNVVLTSVAGTAGVGNTIQIVSGSASILTALGFTATTYTGTASTSATAFTAYAGYKGDPSPGTDGNNLSVQLTSNPKHVGVIGADLDGDATAANTYIDVKKAKGFNVNAVLKITDGTNTEYHIISAIDTTGVNTTRLTLTTALAYSYDYSDMLTTLTTMEFDVRIYYGDAVVETWTQKNVNPLSVDYVLSAVNNAVLGSSLVYMTTESLALASSVLIAAPTTYALTGGLSESAGFTTTDVTGDASAKTGLFAMDGVNVGLIDVPPSLDLSSPLVPANATIHYAMAAYAQSRNCFAILNVPQTVNTEAAFLEYRNNTLGIDSRFAAMPAPGWHYTADSTVPVQGGAKILVPISGSYVGLIARVDAMPAPDGGQHAAPGGLSEFGKLKDTIDLQFAISESLQGDLNVAGINCIIKNVSTNGGDNGFFMMGARTLSTNPKWIYVGKSRMFNYLMESFRTSGRTFVLRDNVKRIWNQVKRAAEGFLSNERTKGQLNGATDAQAFFVEMDNTTMTPTEISQGYGICDIGVALVDTMEFLVFRLAQTEAGTTITEL